jgi:hypothetical protein
MNAPHLLRDVVSARAFPAVVQAAGVRELREIAREAPEDARVNAFTGGFLGVDDRARAALSILLRALSGSAESGAATPSGGAFFLNGVFGSGKSHLLGLLVLLAEGAGHRLFREAHPILAPALGRLPARKYLAVHLALDDYAPDQWSLEDVVWREIALEWKRQNLPELPAPSSGQARREQWDALQESALEHGRGGLLLCVDELSLFLSARAPQGLQADAAFLQFLGQRARLNSPWSLCVVAALQKTVDDIGGIEAYSLHQIRDRYSTLPLSLAHVPTLIERRLVRVEDEAARDQIARATWAQVLEALPRFEGDEDEWRRLLPFHPPVVALLEAVVSRFLSRTRSAVLFCTQSMEAHAASPAATRIGMAELFDYVWPEVEAQPELRPLGEVWESWRRDLSDIAGRASDEPHLKQLAQALLLFKIAGFAPDVPQLAHACAFDAGLRGNNYAFVRVLLERLRTRGGHVAVERRAPEDAPSAKDDGGLGDRWTVDAGLKTAEVARRAMRGLIESLPPGDERVARHAIECCRSPLLPLRDGAGEREARSQAITWRNAPRSVSWRLWSAGESEIEWAANRAALLATPGHADDWLLLVAPPFAPIEPIREAFEQVVQMISRNSASRAGRWRERVALWLPRPALDDEWARAREATAGLLLREDPQMLDNRRGRAVLHHVAQEQEARESLLERTAARLLREGEVIGGDGAAIEAGDLTLGESWSAHVESAAQWALEGVFPRFEPVAPRARVLTPSVGEQLCLEILRRPPDAPFFAPSLERAVRAVAEPLGGAVEREGRRHIAPGRADLIEAMEGALQVLAASTGAEHGADSPDAFETGTAGASTSTSTSVASTTALVSALEAEFGKNEWGLRPEQFHIALCLLLRDGRWQALDGRGATLPPARIGMPLRRSVHAVRRGQKLGAPTWARLRHAAQVLAHSGVAFAIEPGGDFSAQEKARAAIVAWLAEAREECEGARARAHQVTRQMGHSSEDWREFHATMAQAESVLALDFSRPAASLLDDFAQSATDEWLESWCRAQEWRALLEARGSALMPAHAFLSSDDLAAPPEMATARQHLLERMARGEGVLRDEALVADCEAWRDEYARQYLSWHAAQNAAARWLSVERALASDDLRVLSRLESLRNVEFAGARQSREALQDERARRCSHDGSGGPWAAFCPACRLRLGERLTLRPLEELLAPAHADAQRLSQLLQDAGVRERLQRAGEEGEEAAREWLAWNGESAALAGVSSPAHLAVLDEALRPRRVAKRDLHGLPQVLAPCRTRAECERAFASWLDGGQALRPDDEIEWA